MGRSSGVIPRVASDEAPPPSSRTTMAASKPDLKRRVEHAVEQLLELDRAAQTARKRFRLLSRSARSSASERS